MNQFDVEQIYTALDHAGTINPEIVINGITPQITTSTTCVPPLFDLVALATPASGTIKGNSNYAVAICTMGTDGFWSLPSRVVNVGIPAGVDTYSIGLTHLDWRALLINAVAVGPAGYGIFMGPDNNHQTLQGSVLTDFPDTITITSYTPGTVAIPDAQFDHFTANCYSIRHSGSWGGQVTLGSVTTTGFGGSGATWTPGAFVGHVASFIAEWEQESCAVRNYLITANTSNTLTVTGNPLADGVSVADVYTIRFGVTSATVDTITDTTISGSGEVFDTNAEQGFTLRIIDGTCKGQQWPITSNTGDSVTINGAFNPIPDATSVWIIHEPAVVNTANAKSMPMTMPVANDAGSTILIEVDTVDMYDQTCVTNLSPIREMWIWGCSGTRDLTADATQLMTDGRLYCDTTAGSFTVQLLPADGLSGLNLLIQKVTMDANTVTVNTDSSDFFPDGTQTTILGLMGSLVWMKF